jgi:hypothetical protein
MQTRLDAGFSQSFQRSWNDVYLVLVFDTSAGDADLLDKFLALRGYFQAAKDPHDASMKNLAFYFPNRDPEYGQKVALQNNSAVTACEASYVTGAKLLSINAMAVSNSDLLFKAELKR